jgi:hypothetical protein
VLASRHRGRLDGIGEMAKAVIQMVGRKCEQAGRPDLIRSPKRVLAHLWEDSEL